jgi:hypothetical protein
MSNADLLLGAEPLDTAIPRKRKRQRAKANLPAPKEAQVQRAIIDALRLRGILAVHVPNEGKRSVMAGRRLKGEGMRPGWPDLLVYGPGGLHMLMEVKRPGWRPSDLSDNQRSTHARLSELGQVVVVVDGIDAALGALHREGWRW